MEITIEAINAVVERYEPEARHALAIMQDLQHEFNYLPPQSLPAIQAHIGTPLAQLYAIATFYKALSLEPKGRHVIKLCDGTACHMRGANNLVQELGRHLGISPGERTANGEFSLELVNCVGSCALAPVMIVDEDYYGKVTMEQIPAILRKYQGGDGDE
jgi:NADH-quinone oxidoreductase subunit E